MTTCRLIYKSVAQEATLANDSLAALQQTCIDNNERDKITGLLILSGDQFLQVLEGDSDRVNELYAKIVKDERHRDVRLISFEQISERYFADWAMRLIDLYDLPMQPRQFLMRKYPSIEDTVKIPDQLNLVYALLLDAKTFCTSEPWAEIPSH